MKEEFSDNDTIRLVCSLAANEISKSLKKNKTGQKSLRLLLEFINKAYPSSNLDYVAIKKNIMKKISE